jgi:hypothetical protein
MTKIFELCRCKPAHCWTKRRQCKEFIKAKTEKKFQSLERRKENQRNAYKKKAEAIGKHRERVERYLDIMAECAPADKTMLEEKVFYYYGMWESARKTTGVTKPNLPVAKNLWEVADRMCIAVPYGVTEAELLHRNTPKESARLPLGCMFKSPRPMFLHELWARVEDIDELHKKQRKAAREKEDDPCPIPPTPPPVYKDDPEDKLTDGYVSPLVDWPAVFKYNNE